MVRFITRVAVRKKGMETLQALLLLAIALFVSKILKDQGTAAATKAGGNVSSFIGTAGQ